MASQKRVIVSVTNEVSLDGDQLIKNLLASGWAPADIKKLANDPNAAASLANAIKSQPVEDIPSQRIPWDDIEIQDAIYVFEDKSNNEIETQEALGIKIGQILNRKAVLKGTVCKYLKSRSTRPQQSYSRTNDYELLMSEKLNKHIIVIKKPVCRMFVLNQKTEQTLYFRCEKCKTLKETHPKYQKIIATAILNMVTKELRYKEQHHELCDAHNPHQIAATQIIREVHENLEKNDHVNIQQAFEEGKKKAESQGDAILFYDPLSQQRYGLYRASNKNKKEMEIAQTKMIGFERQLGKRCWVINENDNAMLVSTPRLLRTLSEATIVMSDSTFQCAPKDWKQVLCIVALVIPDHNKPTEREWVCVAMAIMKNKEKKNYLNIFGWLKKALDQCGLRLSAERWHVDFEKAAWSAIEKHFGNIVRGCLFHSSQAIIRKANTLHLMQLYQTHDTVRQWIRNLMALLLLPHDHAIIVFDMKLATPPGRPRNVKKEDWPIKEMKQMIDYMRSTWLNENFKISFYGMRYFRNTNPVESYNAFLKRSEYIRIHPALSTFLTTLKRLFLDASNRVKQLKYKRHTKHVQVKYLDLDGDLETFENRYRTEVIEMEDELSDEEIAEKALEHVIRVSYLLQKAKKVKSSLKKCGIDLNATEMGDDNDDGDSEESDAEESDNEEEIDNYLNFFASDNDADDDSDFIDEPSKLSETLVKNVDGYDTDGEFINDEDDIEKPFVNAKSFDYDYGDYHTPPAYRDGYVPSQKEEKITSFSRSRSPQSSFSSSFKRKAPMEESNFKSSKCLKPSNSPQKIIIQRESLRNHSALAGFRPPSEKFFADTCDYLRIPITKTKNSPLRNMKNFESLTLPLTVTNVLGDGNCGYRAFSYILFGKDKYHWMLRKRITEWRNFKEGKKGDAKRQLDLIEQMEKENKDGKAVGEELWMGAEDIKAFAQLFLVNVFCYTKYIDADTHRWNVYSPEEKKNYEHKPGYPDICLYFKNNHYQPVLKTNEQ